MAKDHIRSAEDAENTHIISKKEYVLLAVLEKPQKSENTTGQEQKTKEKIIFNNTLFFYSSKGGYPPIIRLGSPNNTHCCTVFASYA